MMDFYNVRRNFTSVTNTDDLTNPYQRLVVAIIHQAIKDQDHEYFNEPIEIKGYILTPFEYHCNLLGLDSRIIYDQIYGASSC